MRRFVASQILLCIGCLCPAQLTDSEAIETAKRYISAWAPEFKDIEAVVLRDTMPVRGAQEEYFHVQFGEAVVWLYNDGYLKGFANMSAAAAERNMTSGDKYRTEEEAWRALDRVLTELDVPPGLMRATFEREGREGQKYVYRFSMKPSPYGYTNSNGNAITAEMHRVTGRLLGLGVSMGWTYEVPDVRVSESQAVAKAVERFGGSPSGWRSELKYATTDYDRAPEYLKPLISQQVMRLLYNVQKYDAQSRKTNIVVVDSVTGTVLGTQTLIADAHAGTEDPAGDDAQVASSGRTVEGSSKEQVSWLTWQKAAAGAGVLLIVVLGAVRLVRRARA